MQAGILLCEGAPNGLKLVVVEALVPGLLLVEELDGQLLIGMREGTKLQILAGLLLEDAAAVLALVALRVVQLLDLVVRVQASLVPAVPLARTLQVRIAHLREVPTPVALPVVESAARVLVVAGVGELAGRGLEGLQVEAEELVLLQVGEFVGVCPVAVIGCLAVGLAGGGLVEEGVVVDLVVVVGVLASLRVGGDTCSSQVQIICVG
jgi:hypothetical protein